MRIYYASDIDRIFVEGTTNTWAPRSLTVNSYPDGSYVCVALAGTCILGPLSVENVQRQDGTSFTDLPTALAYLQGEFARFDVDQKTTTYALSAATSYTADHGLSYVPQVILLDETGTVVESDVVHAPGQTTVIFATPFTGTLYIA